MNTGLIANRYAAALLEYARQQQSLDVVHDEADRLYDLLQYDIDTLDAVVPTLSDVMQRFLSVVIANGRADCLLFILHAFHERYDHLMGIATAHLVTAVSMPELEQRLRSLLSEKGYREVHFDSTVDPKLLGGFVLRIDDSRVDASVATQVEMLRREFEDKNRKII